MKLKILLNEGTKDIKNYAKNLLPKGKYKHSKEVADLIKKYGGKKDDIHTAYLHDVLERGAKKKDLKKIAGKNVTKKVEKLTVKNDKNKTKQIIKKMNKNDDIIDIKLADRISNLKKKEKEYDEKKLDKYKKKTKKLLKAAKRNSEIRKKLKKLLK